MCLKSYKETFFSFSWQTNTKEFFLYFIEIFYKKASKDRMCVSYLLMPIFCVFRSKCHEIFCSFWRPIFLAISIKLETSKVQVSFAYRLKYSVYFPTNTDQKKNIMSKYNHGTHWLNILLDPKSWASHLPTRKIKISCIGIHKIFNYIFILCTSFSPHFLRVCSQSTEGFVYSSSVLLKKLILFLSWH